MLLLGCGSREWLLGSCPGSCDQRCRGASIDQSHPSNGWFSPACWGFLAHPPARRRANTVLDEGLLGVGVNPRVDHLVTDRAGSVGRSVHGSAVSRTPPRTGGALIWRGVNTWDKPASSPAMITARSRGPSNRRHTITSLQTATPPHKIADTQ